MKTTLALIVLLFASACSGPQVPSAFRPDSPASPGAAPSPRFPVATVLMASDPLDATVCVPEKPCVLEQGQNRPNMDKASPPNGGHDHRNHSGHNH